MSALQKSILRNKLPPRCPKSSGSKMAPFGASRRKDYSPLSWKNYFDKHVDVETDEGTFRVYMTPEPDHQDRPRIITLHGGGYSGLSWSLFAHDVTEMIHCQVLSMDIRGHGETKTKNPDDLSGDTLARDVEQVVHKLFGSEIPPLLLVGHSMGGAIAVRVAHLPSLEHCVGGLAVIDVVEGTAMDALASMQSFLRSRPTHFKSVEHAIEWCVRSGQVRNIESAKVSMPSQIVNCTTGELAINEISETETETNSEQLLNEPPLCQLRGDVIKEEEGDGDTSAEEVREGRDEFTAPAVVDANGDMKYKWRIDLSRSESHWSGWFSGLSRLFLTTRAPRLLLLASIDGLDTHLTVGQMQGKFQMQVLTRCGHAVHEDSPTEVARVISAFALRHRLTSATEKGEELHLVSAPGC